MMLRCPPLRILQSTGLTEVARTRTSTSRGRGAGFSTSSSSRTSGPPYRWIRTARMVVTESSTARRGEVLGLERDRVTDELDLSWQLQRLKRSHGCEEPCGRVRPAWCPQSKLIVPADYEHRHVTGSLYLTRPKSNAGWRIIPLVDPLRSILRHHLEQTPENPHGLVFARPDGSPIRPDEYTQAWVNFMRDYFDGERRIRLHDLRHAAVDLLYLAGVDEATIQEIAGHSTRQMTRAYKSRSSQARLREAMQRMAALPGITSQGEATPL